MGSLCVFICLLRIQIALSTEEKIIDLSPPPLTVVSAANGRYALKELAVLLDVRERAKRESLAVRLIAYNLGGMGQCDYGPSHIWKKFGIEIRDFDFSKYPKHVSDLHCYAWKPPIIAQVTQEVGPNSVVVWIDSGVNFFQSLRSIIQSTKANSGFISDETAKAVARFAHEKVLDFFVKHYQFNATIANAIIQKRAQGELFLEKMVGLPFEFRKFKNCNGAFSAHLYNSPRYHSISTKWFNCSFYKDCICPQGSNRANHRQDQAALTLFAVRDNYVCGTHGKFVAAHGLHGHMAIINKYGLVQRVEHDEHTPSATHKKGPPLSSIFCHHTNEGPKSEVYVA